MKPLSILKFMKGSMRKIFPLAVTVCLSVALLYFLSITINHLVYQNIELNVSPLSNMSLLSGTGEKYSSTDLSSDLKKLRSCRYIKGWYLANSGRIVLKTPSSDNNMLLLIMKNKDISQIMKYQKLKLIEGRMPVENGEVVLHKKLAANYGLKLGSIVKKNSSGWDLSGDVNVVGIIDGPAVIGLQSTREEISLSSGNNISVVTVTDDRSVSLMNTFIEKNFGKRYEFLTLDLLKKEIDSKNHNIQIIMVFVGIIIIIVLCVLLSNICMIQYTQRSKEFELLHALGYTKKFIAVKVLKEIGSGAVLGYITGIIIAIICGWLMNVCLLGDKALGMPLVIVQEMMWVLLVPISVTLFGMLTPIKLIKFKDIV